MKFEEHRDARPDTPADRQMLTLMYPSSREEFMWGLRHGYLVAVTPEQRVEWDLRQYGDLPVLTPQEVLEVAFAEPGDAIHERFDVNMEPDDSWDPHDPSLPNAERMQEYLEEEQRVDALISVRVRTGVRPEDAPPPSPPPLAPPPEEENEDEASPTARAG